MRESMTPQRRALLIQLESILGNQCYNSNIQNYGPGGVRLSSGRSFRYPLTFWMNSEKKKIKLSDRSSISDDVLLSGHYAFGANQLDVMRGICEIVEYFENQFALNVDGNSKEKR